MKQSDEGKRFEDLTRRILMTPKGKLVKQKPKPKKGKKK
jgi:hypothetical protein